MNANDFRFDMDKFVQTFAPETGQVHKNEQVQLKVHLIVDWSISSGLVGGEEYKKFFDCAEDFKNYLPDESDKCFRNFTYTPLL
jgi:hypothetical protein